MKRVFLATSIVYSLFLTKVSINYYKIMKFCGAFIFCAPRAWWGRRKADPPRAHAAPWRWRRRCPGAAFPGDSRFLHSAAAPPAQCRKLLKFPAWCGRICGGSGAAGSPRYGGRVAPTGPAPGFLR